jgi:hypothetical protein
MAIKKLVLGFLLLLLFSGFIQDDNNNDIYPVVRNESFKKGEVIKFKMTYGIFTVGKGSAQINGTTFKVNDRDCFKVDVYGKTVGMVDWVADVDDQWGSYIDTVALVPHMFYRKIREGHYKKDEQTLFSHKNKKIEVKTLDNDTGKFKESKYYDAPPQVRDMVAGFLLLRVMDLSKKQIGDTITVAGFFEDEFYKFRILYNGKRVVKTKVGKIRALEFIPVMPKNKIFDGENSITAWFSDDKNRIPIKINAEMFIGSAGVELTEYSGLKNPLNIVK